MADRTFKAGMTLIEMLVVMVIIAIIISIIMPVVFHVLQEAKIAECQQLCNEIDSAVMKYYQDIGELPLPDDTHGSSDGQWKSGYSSSSHQAIIFDMLTGQNVKRKVYLKRELSDDGLIRDPWGRKFTMFFDRNYDGNTDLAKIVGSSDWDGGTTAKGARFVILSRGLNGEWDHWHSPANDDISNVQH